jgi:hypothetical protein
MQAQDSRVPLLLNSIFTVENIEDRHQSPSVMSIGYSSSVVTLSSEVFEGLLERRWISCSQKLGKDVWEVAVMMIIDPLRS